MKFLRSLLFVVIMILMVACSSSGYNADICNSLCEKVSNKEALTQADYSEMIKQVGYMDDDFKAMTDKAGDDAEANMKLLSDEKVANMLGYTAVFVNVLTFTDDLDADNTKAWEDLQKRFEQRDN